MVKASKDTVVIIDYGSGNLRSAAKAFEHICKTEDLQLDIIISDRADDVLHASRIVLPGQGAFGDCMDGLSSLDGMIEALNEAVLTKATPFLGICVGMQLMASRGMEHGVHAGLNWIEGQVVPFNLPTTYKVPHMGWNSLILPLSGGQDNLPIVLRSIKNSSTSSEDYYFVHSFVFDCKYNHNILAMADYGGLFPAIVGKNNMIGVQFHPEKSQKTGLKLLSDFLQWHP